MFELSDDEMGMGGNMYTAVLALVFLFIFLSCGAFLFTLWEVSYTTFFRGVYFRGVYFRGVYFGDVWGSPQKMRLQGRLCGINTVSFLILMVSYIM